MNTEINKIWKQWWWKILCILLLLYSYSMGIYSNVPKLGVLHETIRNLYYHVPLWFAMTILLVISTVASILYLRTRESKYDFMAVESANVGVMFGILGWATGMLWGYYAWGSPLPKDTKLLAAGIGMFVYFAYFILRGSMENTEQRARISAIFNILAMPTFMALIYVIPRLDVDSLHPGNGGNPAFKQYDRDRDMNIIFYSAGLGMILLGIWITSLRMRIRIIEEKLND